VWAMMHKGACCAALLCTALAFSVWADQYFVGPEGDDANVGGEGAPFATVGKAVSVANPGDVITILTGTYKETIDLYPEHSGTETSPLVIQGESIEGVVFDADLELPELLVIRGADYVHVKKMTFRNTKNLGVQMETGAVRVQDHEEEPATGCVLEDLVTEQCEGVAFGFIRVVDCIGRRLVAQDNLGSGIGGNAVEDLLLKGCRVLRSNPGWDYNPFPALANEGNIIENSDGKWRLKAGWEAGGGKFVYTKSCTVEDHLASDCYGPACGTTGATRT
ncbi:MAG: DUF1565 domain-containing protein, partial [Chitinivibrionales bacterium]|nr:DUF1565 domain-containing protein [Chitinivibrionales bacterium]MBD3394584.1 DUF1565 domain-containing protein [Chitinivibrionales bacterium]